MPAREFLRRNWHVITIAMTAAAIACAALVMLAAPPIGSQDIIPAIDLVLEIYIFVLLAVVILAWLISFRVVPSDARGTAPAQAFLRRATDPVLRPIRFVLPHASIINVSPVIMIIIIMAMRYALAIYALPDSVIGSVDNTNLHNYCVYAGKAYSFWSYFCVAKGLALRCDGAAAPTATSDDRTRYSTPHWTVISEPSTVPGQAFDPGKCKAPTPQ